MPGSGVRLLAVLCSLWRVDPPQSRQWESGLLPGGEQLGVPSPGRSHGLPGTVARGQSDIHPDLKQHPECPRTPACVGIRATNITVEDPTKHLRHAAFLGMHDSVQGSSANVLAVPVPLWPLYAIDRRKGDVWHLRLRSSVGQWHALTFLHSIHFQRRTKLTLILGCRAFPPSPPMTPSGSFARRTFEYRTQLRAWRGGSCFCVSTGNHGGERAVAAAR